jgi:hypothetical protein
MPDRRYDDAEIAEILARATRDEGKGQSMTSGPEPTPTGLTLPELESIGAEVGISPVRIAEAARSLDRRSLDAGPSLLGVRRGVGQVVPLGGPIEGPAWDRLVAELRSTFRAQGKVAVDGSLRSWRNGNLAVHVEPDAQGWRLRMQTFKGDAAPMAGLGVGAVAMGLLIGTTAWVSGAAAHQYVVAGSFVAGGAGLVTWVRVHLGSWAREREAQMERLAAWVPGLVNDRTLPAAPAHRPEED